MAPFAVTLICADCGNDFKRGDSECAVCRCARSAERFVCGLCNAQRLSRACDCRAEAAPVRIPTPAPIPVPIPAPPAADDAERAPDPFAEFFGVLVACILFGAALRAVLGIADGWFGWELRHCPGSTCLFAVLGGLLGLSEKKPEKQADTFWGCLAIGTLAGWAFGAWHWFAASALVGVVAGIGAARKP